MLLSLADGAKDLAATVNRLDAARLALAAT
jgi:hypothetical protein